MSRLLPCAGALAAASWAASAPAQTAEGPVVAAPLQRVEIRRSRDTNEERRRATAAKTIVSRDDIQRQGDDNVADALKRLPGVTVDGAGGRGGEVRMRGMGGGYTQILINGQAMPPGFSLDSLSPDQIERVEILRGTSAEFSAQAVAGTINIILREDVRQPLNTAKVALGDTSGRPQTNFSWDRGDGEGPFSYTFSAGAARSSFFDSSRTVTTTRESSSVSVKDEHEQSRTRRERGNAGGRLQWKASDDEVFSLSPFVLYSQSRTAADSTVAAPVPAGTYSAAHRYVNSYYALGRTAAEWRTPLAVGGQFELKVTGNLSQWTSHPRREESNPDRQLVSDSRSSDNGVETSGKYSRTLANGHQVAGGWKLDRTFRRERQVAMDSSITTPADQARQNDTFRGTQTWSALWAQDEWSPAPQWTTQLGARWERIGRRGWWVDADTGATPHSESRTSVLSPMLHALWKPDLDSKDQVRASLTGAFKAPSTGQILPRRSIAQAYPVDGPNTPTSPDRIGNPNLRPERSTGVDLAYEHYLPNGGLLSVGLFHRQIRDVIRNVTSNTAQAVPWSTVPRYVSQPMNLSSAQTTGVELEAKLRLDELATDLPKVNLRANASFFRSAVSGVPGPDNRLDRQPNYTANFGGDYRWPATPLTTGASLNLTPPYDVQQSELLRAGFGPKRVLDAYAAWVLTPTAQLRFTASNLFPRTTRTSTSFTNPATGYDESMQSEAASTTQWLVRLEMRL